MSNKLIILIISLLGLFVNISIVNGQDFPYTLSTNSNHMGISVNPNDSIKDIVIPKNDNSTLDKISKNFLGTDFRNQSSPAVYYISKFINYFLSILAFIAFIVLVYGFSMVFIGKTDEGIKKGGKFIKMAIIAIITIGVSWLISMWVISIYAQHVVK